METEQNPPADCVHALKMHDSTGLSGHREDADEDLNYHRSHV